MDVASRFGADAVLAHRAARGEPERPPSARTLPPDLEVEQHYDPSIERVDAAAFAGRAWRVSCTTNCRLPQWRAPACRFRPARATVKIFLGLGVAPNL